MSQFTDALPELFESLGRVTIKRMFGGAGLWHDGLMCALVVRDTLYLKTDETTRPFFDALDLPAFSYERGGKVMETSYRQPPETVFEDRQDAALWVRRAYEAALRAANAKPVRAASRKQAPAKKKPSPSRPPGAGTSTVRPAARKAPKR
ncbi:TfoX/Sxy family protein [Xenophilus aerolatus]|nr:TfoX/Sxy family protein [Xenophilus aerolatus]